MNKGELVEAVAERAALDRRQAEGAVNAIVDAVMDATKRGERVAVLGFGTFTPTTRGARTGRNPRTGEPVDIAASNGVRFAPGAAFKTALNTKPAKKTGAAKKPTTATKTSATKTSATKTSATKTSATKTSATKTSATKAAPAAKAAAATKVPSKAPSKKAAKSTKKQ